MKKLSVVLILGTVACIPNTPSPAPPACMDAGTMIHSDDHGVAIVWYQDSEGGPIPVGVSTHEDPCIRKYSYWMNL